MKFFFTLSFLLCLSAAFAQQETELHQTASANFERYYNAGRYDSVFYMFSEKMQRDLPLKTTDKVLKGLSDQSGRIKAREFTGISADYARYKTTFDKTILTLSISVDAAGKVNGLLLTPYKDESLPKTQRNSVAMKLPFKDEWTVVWGGDTKKQNYHVISNAQKNAFDILITDENDRTHKGKGKQNEDFYAYGKSLYAPCNGEVVQVTEGIPDNKPGEMNAAEAGGNMVIIKAAEGEYAVFCHFKTGSITVKKGQQVKTGDLLGLCGNSGNSSEPHLHFHLQNGPDMNTATGVKCFFDKLMVNGKLMNDYSPVQGDKVLNQIAEGGVSR